MSKRRLLMFIKSILLTCSVLLLPCLSPISLNASEEELNKNTLDFGSRKLDALKQKNIGKANKLIETLYTETFENFGELSDDPQAFLQIGTQAGYYGKEGTDNAYSPLVIYKRVWIYDAAIALSLAIKNEDPTADARALWLLKQGQYTRDPKNPEVVIFAGWPFSMNQKHYGDDWTDCRFITGANAYAVKGIADYITSDYYLALNDKFKAEYSKLFAAALSGILYHIEPDGPNESLVTAGWSINVLDEFSKTNYSYNKILDLFGYGPKAIEGYPDPIRRAKSRNVVTEHCNNVLSVINYSLDHYDKLFGANAPYTYDELNAIRIKLRDAMFDKLYDADERHLIAGRSASGIRSPYTAIDNASWLSLSLKLNELSANQAEALSDSLVYTIENFTKDFEIGEKTYFGAHYFEDGFEDMYIEKSDSHSKALHVEATCGLICGLTAFANAYPDDPNTPVFRSTALKLWENLQYFLNDHGFVYASSSLKDVTEPIQASVSAIWYLWTCDYLQ